jgi:hypothetical protein
MVGHFRSHTSTFRTNRREDTSQVSYALDSDNPDNIDYEEREDSHTNSDVDVHPANKQKRTIASDVKRRRR